MSIEPPCRTLAEYVGELVARLGAADPAALERMRAVVDGRRARIRLDDEAVDVGSRARPARRAGGHRRVDGKGETDRAAVLDLLDGYLEVTDAILDGRLDVTGAVDESRGCSSRSRSCSTSRPALRAAGRLAPTTATTLPRAAPAPQRRSPRPTAPGRARRAELAAARRASASCQSATDLTPGCRVR